MKTSDKRRTLGENLRTIRKLHNWSLSDISKMTGIPLSSLSKVENGHATLSFEKIVVLTEKLGIEFADLVKPERKSLPPASRSITRTGTGPRLKIGGLDFQFLSGELTASKSVAFRVTVANPRDDDHIPPYNHHSGEEFVYVLSGTLVLYTEYYEPLVLNAGDSVMFDASMDHAYAYAGDEPADVIMVNDKYITPTSQTVFESLRLRPE
ncbi:helix-turn-helix domain-containing protein [Mesorhizobium sp. CO1-1-8]|uniref:helix-turn-helix domain-containing protein n=1 Tax=Mesorhizobium sp. CO1-1-8 TaxID=2876631 RepID=UPI001CD11E01|nr:XRE family transcriptional regulator [Mesorhizobium sp. CO1-1-8]MBZ9772481.1 XRE family transcriptional regulator [Mesorhizobium sp. CO1-1-8]